MASLALPLGCYSPDNIEVAALWSAQGKHDQALACYFKALLKLRKARGEDHLSVGMAYQCVLAAERQSEQNQ